MSSLSTSYKSILKISFPIMLGSAAQNVIALIDSVLLYHLSEVDFAAIGFVGVFYLMIAAVGYGFSKGGQIVIARYYGADEPEKIGKAFRAMLTFELILAAAMFLFMHFGSYAFFSIMVNSDVIFYKSLEYLEYRSWGVFFAFAGTAFIALYTGISRTNYIMITALIMAIVNGILCWILVFGKFGFDKMGIQGAGLSSTIAEICGVLIFMIFMFFDEKIKPFKLLERSKIDWELIKLQYKISLPIIVQMVMGMASWFTFFSFIENLGDRALAISNLVRNVYLILCIPVLGYSSAINTLVSLFIGNRKRMAVVPITMKTAQAALYTTMLLALPVVFFPEQILYPLLGKSDMSLIQDAQPVFYVLLGILAVYSYGSIFFNGLVGTGATWFGLKLQIFAVVMYLLWTYLIIEVFHLGLAWAWASEILYWLLMFGIAIWYLRSGKWHWLKIWEANR